MLSIAIMIRGIATSDENAQPRRFNNLGGIFIAGDPPKGSGAVWLMVAG